MVKISASFIIFSVGFLLFLITVSATSDEVTSTTAGTQPEEGHVCPLTRDSGGPTGTDRAARGLSCSGCIKKCFKKCGKSKTKIDLACRQMTATEWGCGCCCSNDHYAPI
ncbi:hypothetical protein MKW98_020959 [Papaver atlanticum]|uniref:Uncharacterized protein n=1 Tax=Papaver atlanticum TaxID=357466 RepID=A0AAD4TCK3_9MAGN|nr:hypothetical protein MKW98_020959 [Papaver atlanticum]